MLLNLSGVSTEFNERDGQAAEGGGDPQMSQMFADMELALSCGLGVSVAEC